MVDAFTEDNDLDTDGSFDDNEDIFDEPSSVFEDRQSIFATPKTEPVDSSNPLTTKEEEEDKYEKPHDIALPRKRLVARFDAQGRPSVAIFRGDKPLEDFRVPTAEEVQSLRLKGKLIRGGMGAVSTVDDGALAPAAKPAPATVSVKKVVVGGVVLVGAAAAAWWLWKRYRDEADGEAEDVED